MYQKLLVEHHLPALWDLFLANPMASILMGFQRALYRVPTPLARDPVTKKLVPVHVLPPVGVGWLALVIACVALGSLLLAALAWRTFFRLSGDFAEEL
jgi:hypothetical protein